MGRDDFGRLVGLAESWPDDHEVELFKLVLDNWPTFMAGVKVAIAAEGASGKGLYLEYPSISVMRKFHEVAVEMHMTLTGKSLAGRPLPLMA